MDNRVIIKYLMGLIKYKCKEKAYLPKNIETEDDRVNLLFKAITELRTKNSAMTPEIIMATVREMFSSIADAEEWEDHQDWFDATVYSAVDFDVSEDEIPELYSIIQRDKINRMAKNLLSQLIDGEFNEERLTDALKKLRILKSVYPSKSVKLNDQVAAAVIEAINNNASIIPYGFPPIDEEIGGLCRKEVTILAGRPGHGKTSLVCQFIINWLEAGYKVLFVSKEMPTARLIHKLISNLGSISANDIKCGTVEDASYLESVADAIITRYKDRLFIYDDVYKPSDIEALIIKHRPDIFVDDYIQITDFTGVPGDQLRHQIGNVVRDYKELSKEYNFASFVLSQLSRSIEGREDPVPRMSDLAESAALEQVAGDICFIYYKYRDTYNKADRNKAEFIIAKARYGEPMRKYIGFDGKHMRYYSLPSLKSSQGVQQ